MTQTGLFTPNCGDAPCFFADGYEEMPFDGGSGYAAPVDANDPCWAGLCTDLGERFFLPEIDPPLGANGAANNFGQGPTKPPSDPSHPAKPGTMTCPGELLAGAMRALGCFYEFSCPNGQVYQGIQKCSIVDPYGYKLCPATSTIQVSPGQAGDISFSPPPGFCGPVKPN